MMLQSRDYDFKWWMSSGSSCIFLKQRPCSHANAFSYEEEGKHHMQRDLFLKRLFFKVFCGARTTLQSVGEHYSSVVVGGIVSISIAGNLQSRQKFDLHKWLVLNKWSTQKAPLFGCEMFLFRAFHFKNLLFFQNKLFFPLKLLIHILTLKAIVCACVGMYM